MPRRCCAAHRAIARQCLTCTAPGSGLIFPLGITHSGAAMSVLSLADLASAVKARRKELGMTQAELARVARTGNRFIVDLEKGKPTLQVAKVLAVASLLELDLYLKLRRGAPARDARPAARRSKKAASRKR